MIPKGKKVALYKGDCLERLKKLPDNSVDSIVTDPPYGLSDHKPADVVACMTAWLAGQPFEVKKKGFMNKTWDSWVPGPEVWREAYRVLKPGAYMLVFASTRTDDLMSMAVRLAGFKKHPFLAWIYGSGFPKAASMSKAFDKEAGAEREVVGVKPGHEQFHGRDTKGHIDFKGGTEGFARPWMQDDDRRAAYHLQTAPATDDAQQWDGWFYGLQSLKPSMEPILMFQKPHQGKMTDNVRRHGTGALNIDGCRIGFDSDADRASAKPGGKATAKSGALSGKVEYPGCDDYAPDTLNQDPADVDICTNCYHRAVDHRPRAEFKPKDNSTGRWPANVVHDGSPEVVALFPSGGAKAPVKGTESSMASTGNVTNQRERVPGAFHADQGSAARFFKQCGYDDEDMSLIQRFMYCPKASKRDRDQGLDHLGEQQGAGFPMRSADGERQGLGLDGSQTDRATTRRNIHPTVKPVDLMRWLIRLITPPGGIVLDFFTGSGSTGKAAILEGFRFVGIEKDEDEHGNSLGYMDIITGRIRWAIQQVEQADNDNGEGECKAAAQA